MMHVLPDTCRRRLFKNYTFLLWTFVGLQGLNIEKKTEDWGNSFFVVILLVHVYTTTITMNKKILHVYENLSCIYSLELFLAMIINVIFNNLLLTVNFKVVINLGGEEHVFLLWQSNKMRGY